MRFEDLNLPVPEQQGVASLDTDLMALLEAHNIELIRYTVEPIDDEDGEATARWIIEGKHPELGDPEE